MRAGRSPLSSQADSRDWSPNRSSLETPCCAGSFGRQPVLNFELFTKCERNLLGNVASATIKDPGKRRHSRRVLQIIGTDAGPTTRVLEWEGLG